MKPVQLKKARKNNSGSVLPGGRQGQALPSAAMSLCWNILRGVKPQAPGLFPHLPHGIPAREGMLWLGGGFALLEQTKSSLCSWGYFGGVGNTELGWSRPPWPSGTLLNIPP